MINLQLGPCPDALLGNIQNKTIMELYGWDMGKLKGLNSYTGSCGNSAFVKGAGSLSATFHEYGKASLDLGQCGYSSTSYEISVTLNGSSIVSFSENKESVVSTFYYKPNDELVIKSSYLGSYMIIKSLQLYCGGTFFYIYNKLNQSIKIFYVWNTSISYHVY